MKSQRMEILTSRVGLASLVTASLMAAWVLMLGGCATTSEYKYKSTVANSYGNSRDIKALTNSLQKEDVCSDLTYSNDQRKCRERTNIILAYSFFEAGDFRKTLQYLDKINVQHGYLGPYKEPLAAECVNGSPFSSIYDTAYAAWAYLPTGSVDELGDTIWLNYNWYQYQAKKRLRDSDIAPWLHKTYLCALLLGGDMIYANAIKYGKPSSQAHTSYKTRLDGRRSTEGVKSRSTDSAQTGGLFAAMSAISALSRSATGSTSETGATGGREQLPNLYVEEVRMVLGDADAEMARKFVDKIYKPLVQKEEEIYAGRSRAGNNSEMQRASLVELYNNAASASQNMALPAIYSNYLIKGSQIERDVLETGVRIKHQ